MPSQTEVPDRCMMSSLSQRLPWVVRLGSPHQGQNVAAHFGDCGGRHRDVGVSNFAPRSFREARHDTNVA